MNEDLRKLILKQKEDNDLEIERRDTLITQTQESFAESIQKFTDLETRLETKIKDVRKKKNEMINSLREELKEVQTENTLLQQQVDDLRG